MKAVDYLSKSMSKNENNTIKQRLELVKTLARSSILTFCGKYYEYDGTEQMREMGLKIGAFESKWLADLAFSFQFEQKRERVFW